LLDSLLQENQAQLYNVHLQVHSTWYLIMSDEVLESHDCVASARGISQL